MQWSWLLARLVMSLCFGQVQQLSKMEVEDLLRKGAYGALMDEEDEGSKFCEEDIDQILQRRTQTITIQSEGKGSTFAKVCCAPLGGKGDFLWWGREGNMQGSSGQPTSSPVCGDVHMETKLCCPTVPKSEILLGCCSWCGFLSLWWSAEH